MRPGREQLLDLHQRLLAREADAPAALIEAVLDPLLSALRREFPPLQDPDLVDSSVIDALLAFVKSPDTYQPRQSSLWTYLRMIARRDLLNALDRERRRAGPLTPLEDVELSLPDRNSSIEDQIMGRVAPEGLPDHVSLETVRQTVEAAFSDVEERAVLQLLLAGAFRTEDFARVLQIRDRPEAEQRRLVKRAKDRVQVRLKRIGQRLTDHTDAVAAREPAVNHDGFD